MCIVHRVNCLCVGWTGDRKVTASARRCLTTCRSTFVRRSVWNRWRWSGRTVCTTLHRDSLTTHRSHSSAVFSLMRSYFRHDHNNNNNNNNKTGHINHWRTYRIHHISAAVSSSPERKCGHFPQHLCLWLDAVADIPCVVQCIKPVALCSWRKKNNNNTTIYKAPLGGEVATMSLWHCYQVALKYKLL